ncbi:LysE family transporter [Methanococcoides sp. FTZ1]|uniref:LysE family transporter n=1 Tax=Methanococcoides sp. FTZ1 TaxID=3439061 RepID=UPI003F85E26F
MLELFEMLFIGFVVGLTGALVPGPMLFVTIDGTLKKGWTAGPEVFLGHAIIESAVLVLILLGMNTLVGEREMSFISVVGGIVLVIFGIMTIRGAGSSAEELHGQDKAVSNSLVAGIVTSASNPYFWLWWLAAGSALVLESMKLGMVAVVFFIVGHWLADLGWFTAVSLSFSHGRGMFSPKTYRHILVSCGLFLILFGGWFAIG